MPSVNEVNINLALEANYARVIHVKGIIVQNANIIHIAPS